MLNGEISQLHRDLSRLRQREYEGEVVDDEIQTVLRKLELLERNQYTKQTTVDVRGDLTGSAVGENAKVNADIIAHHYNPQSFNENRQNVHVYGGGNAHDQPIEVMAGNILADWALRIYNQAPKAITVGLTTIMPVLLLFSPETFVIAIPLIATVTTTGIYVLLETQFMRIPVETLKHRKFLFYATQFMRGAGVLTIALLVISYFIAMLVMSALMNATREQIGRS